MQHLENKRVLVESCRNLLEALKAKEEEAAQHARHAVDKIGALIEQEKKSFRSSQDDRLQRVRYVTVYYGILRYISSVEDCCQLSRFNSKNRLELFLMCK